MLAKGYDWVYIVNTLCGIVDLFAGMIKNCNVGCYLQNNPLFVCFFFCLCYSFFFDVIVEKPTINFH
jgi:hypothetical protein